MDSYELGSTPSEEECQQVGSDNYSINGRKECRVYKEFLERNFPIPKHLSLFLRFVITSNPHDFGTYYDVAIKFNGDVEEAANFACKVEDECPGEWDEEAREELRSVGLL